MSIPNLTLNNGVALPALGYGVFQTPPDETVAAVAEALRVGYRHIDTAAAYGNEREVGRAIRESGIARDDLFVETKVWISDYGYDETLHAFDKSAGKLAHAKSPARIAENFDAFDVELTAEELAALDTDVRGGPEPEQITLEAFGREIPEA